MLNFLVVAKKCEQFVNFFLIKFFPDPEDVPYVENFRQNVNGQYPQTESQQN